MTNRKNNSSVLFLSTLGVYLGLVLVGATPVLGHAAMARQFDIQDEIEVKDDLDKKPRTDNDLDQNAEAIESLKITEAISEFLVDIKTLESIGKVNGTEDWIFSHKVWLEEFALTNAASKNSDISNPWLETAAGQLVANAGRSTTSSVSPWLANCSDRNCRESSVEVSSNANEFFLKFGFIKSSPERAEATAMRFSEIFVARKVELKNSRKLPIYENTRCAAENNQVFIVTRLPRAGLESLLAKDAK